MVRTVKHAAILAGAVASLLPVLGVQAAIVTTPSLDKTSMTYFAVSSTDLIDQSQTTLASQSDSGYTPFTPGGAGATTVLNDGSVGTTSMSTGTFEYGDGSSTHGDGAYIVTYNLNTTVNTAGYDITSFATYTGWVSSDDRNRVGVDFTVSYTKVVGAPGTIGNYVNDPISGPSTTGENVSSKTLVELSGTDVVTGVNSLTFSFAVPPKGSLNPQDVTSIIREVDAFGTATVPEPMALSLLGLASLTALARRRKA